MLHVASAADFIRRRVEERDKDLSVALARSLLLRDAADEELSSIFEDEFRALQWMLGMGP
jgi:hypothetical protein